MSDSEPNLPELFQLLNGKNMVMTNAPITNQLYDSKKLKVVEDTPPIQKKCSVGPGSIIDLLG